MDNYITLAELRKTAEALLIKMDNELENKVSLDEINNQTGNIADFNYKVASIGDKDLTVDRIWISDIAYGIINNYQFPVTSVNGQTGDVDITIPSVPSWALAAEKPTYTAAEVGALPDSTVIPEDKIFVAIKDVTTYAEVKSAIDAGKVVFAKDSNYSSSLIHWRLSSIVQNTTPECFFVDISGYDGANSSRRINYLRLRSPNTWYQNYWTIPYQTSNLTNDSDFQTSADVNSLIATAIGNINSFNISVVSELPASNIDTHTIYFLSNSGASPDSYDEYMYINSNWEKIGNTAVDLNGYLQTSDIADWAKAATKPTYTANEVGALPSTTTYVSAVNGQTGNVTISDSDEKVKSTPLNGANSTRGLLISSNTGASETTDTVFTTNKLAWNDYSPGLYIYNPSRSKYSLLSPYSIRFSNNTTDYSGSLKTEAITANRTYSLPDASGTIALTSDIPTKLSQFNNDSGFITSYTETDPTVPAWAKAATKPTYTASEVGAVAKTGDTMTGQLVLDYNNGNDGLRFNRTINNVNYYGVLQPDGYGGDASSYNMRLRFSSGGNSANGVILQGIYTPSDQDTAAANKKYVDDKFAAVSYPVTSVNSQTGAITLSASDVGAMSTSHAANAITATDISNWNAKVSDDKTWNGVSLNRSEMQGNDVYYLPSLTEGTTSSTTARFVKATTSPQLNCIPKYDTNAYLKSTTPPATDNTSKVATTAYVTTAISNVKTPFIATFTYDESLEATVCDKTYTEICNAIDNGNLIIGKQGSDTTTSYQDYREAGTNRVAFHFEGQSMLSSDNTFTSISFFDYMYNVNSDNSVTTSGTISPAFEQQADFPVHFIQLTYYDTVNDKRIYSSGETITEIYTMINNYEIVILTTGSEYYYFSGYDRGVADLTFIGGQLGGTRFYPYKLETNYTNYWCSESSVVPSLSEGTLIATINGVSIYAPSYTDADGVSY